jgi:hypothetical protein
VLLFVLGLLLLGGAAEAKTYSAERFDSYIRMLADGAIEVTETVVFRFDDGTFTYVFREIPRRRTNGIEILQATMDGRELPVGTEPGQVAITRNSRLRVRWNFAAPVSRSTHTFTLTYRVDGVVRQSERGDLLAWRALPSAHDYAIQSSAIEVEHPAPLSENPDVETRRVSDLRVAQGGKTFRISASSIRRNGWVEVWLRFPAGSIIASPPEWQATQQRADALGPRWALAASLVLAAGVVLLWSTRQRYDAPRGSFEAPGAIAGRPDDAGPAIAGALAANGRVALEHAMAVLFSLADRGAIAVSEEPRSRFGQRHFRLSRQRPRGPIAPHEQVALELAFRHKQQEEDSVPLAKARSRLSSNIGRFRTAVRDEMTAAGLIDPERRRLHGRYGAISLTIVLLGAALFVAAALFVREYRGWPFLVPVSVLLVGLAGFIMQAATTPLSNEGVRRGARWRAYQKHLKAVARNEVHLTTDAPDALLPLAVALGLAGAWAKFVRKHPAQAPAWFHALSDADPSGFPVFIADGGATASAGGAGGAGGAAGGGASGAG